MCVIYAIKCLIEYDRDIWFKISKTKKFNLDTKKLLRISDW